MAAAAASLPVSKRAKLNAPLIGTHNGHFHADEALAVYLLRLLPGYAGSALIRTRDPALLRTCHTVVDVGGEYSVETNRYDHHMRTFTTTFPDHSTKLSSAGLVYMHFGKDIIAQRLGTLRDDSTVSLLHKKLYADFIEALDANDNGISAYDPSEVVDIKKRFNDGGVTIGSIVSDFNNDYAAPTPTSPEDAQAQEDSRFLKASEFVGSVFLRKLAYCQYAWLPARERVTQAMSSRCDVHPSGHILLLPHHVPWKDHLYTFEDSNSIPPASQVLYVLYPESGDANSKWRIQAVSNAKDSFESRKALPEKWRGMRDEELDKITGIEGCIFCHASGFIGGNKTFEGVKKMAIAAVDM